ncbi:MAG: HYR domain-containing protein [Acidobacteriota bacterium]
MRQALGAMMMLIAVNAMAGSVSSLSPASVNVMSGEYFIAVNGSGLGHRLIFDGPAGHYEVDTTYTDPSGNVTGWIPQEVINTYGTYSLVVQGGTGDSVPVTFRVLKPGRLPLNLHLPELLVAISKGRLGAGIKYDVSFTGGDEATATIKCDPPSGFTFPFGKSLIRCSAADLEGGRAEGEISVNVWDATPPVLSLPKSFEIAADSLEGAYVKYDVSASDDIDDALKVICLPDSGKVFVPGRTTVACETADSSLNPAYGSFEVMVRPKDTGKLELKVPDDFKVTTDNKEGAFVTYEVTAFGSADPDPVVTCSPESGSFFKMGSNKVICSAIDDFDQRAENGFTVDVVEESLLLKDVNAEASSPSGADVSFDSKPEGWTAEVTCSQESGSLFAMGNTTVDCTSKNPRGRLVKGSFTVTVADTIAPHIAGVRFVQGLADADQNVAVNVEVDAIDAADAMPRCSVSGIEAGSARITSDLTLSGRTNADLRVQVSCADSAGNRTTETYPLRVGPAGRHRATTN